MVRFYLTERENNDLVYIIFDTVVCQSAVGNSDVVNRVGMEYFRKEREMKIMDDLARIERNYGSVAEYNRCMEEDAEYEAEQKAKWLSYCENNKAKLDGAGKRAMRYCEDCFGCKYYDDVGPTYIDSWGYQDDIPHGICRHREIPPIDGVGCKRREEVDA